MEVLMPQLGETVTEGKITVWFKSVGDAIAPGDNLFEIETDKVSMEVPATSAGVLREIRVRQGEVAPVSAIVAIIGDGAINAEVPVQVKPRPASLDAYNEVHTPPRNFGPATLANGTKVSPLARRLAAEAGVDLANVKGSGPHGRIHANDIKAIKDVKTVKAERVPVAVPIPDAPFERVPLDAMRRTIARRLVEAKQTVPHFYLSSDVNLDSLLNMRERANAELSAKLSINDFIIKAYALALQRVPAANAVWAEAAEAAILRFRHSDVGVAVAIEGGLLTPVIRMAETKSLSAISAEMKDLAARARERKLLPQEYQGGAGTISNLGMYGVREFSAIINPPQSTILAVGAGQRRPVEAPNGGIAFATMMTVTLSCDHRVVDGALGAQLLSAFKAVMENPITLFL
jgi:pyruvate dehydrogenase E2 component (dihydrolipoamide acetyltransferase)